MQPAKRGGSARTKRKPAQAPPPWLFFVSAAGRRASPGWRGIRA